MGNAVPDMLYASNTCASILYLRMLKLCRRVFLSKESFPKTTHTLHAGR